MRSYGKDIDDINETISYYEKCLSKIIIFNLLQIIFSNDYNGKLIFIYRQSDKIFEKVSEILKNYFVVSKKKNIDSIDLEGTYI
jgi:hypothetical protein